MDDERGAGRDVDAAAGQDDGRSVSLEAVLARKTPPHQRILRLALMLVVVFGVAGGLLLRQTILNRPATSPRAAHGPYVAALIQSNVSWGTVTLNGKRLGTVPQRVTIDGADNVITLAAPPFSAQICHVAVTTINNAPGVVSTGGQACDAITQTGPDPAAPPTALVSVLLGGASLPDGLRAAAQPAIMASLATFQEQATVPVGEYYATGQDAQGRPISRRATAPLTATLDVLAVPRRHSGFPACGDPGCGGAFTTPLGALNRVWAIAVNVALRWRFTDAFGAQVGEATFLRSNPLSLDLLYDGHGWQPEGEHSVPAGVLRTEQLLVCPVGVDLISGYQQGNDISVAGIGEEPQSCAFQLQDLAGAAIGLVIWRFGVLLAGDAAAHKLLPTLPMAPATEIAEAGGTVA